MEVRDLSICALSHLGKTSWDSVLAQSLSCAGSCLFSCALWVLQQAVVVFRLTVQLLTL